MTQSLLENKIFHRFCADIAALGFTLSDRPAKGSMPYAVVGGRSNSRWWLVPLESRRLASSGLALFQPVVPSAKILKLGALTANSLGLSKLWARKVIYISGGAALAAIFGKKDLCYAFFTGTDSPHRKAAVQVMDRDGRITGFAKVSCNPVIKALLSHEAETLRSLRTLELETVLVPNVLFHGTFGGADVLVTDTLKTRRTKTATTLNGAHIAFLRELEEKTAVPGTAGTGWFVPELRKQYESVAEGLTTEWQRRLEKAIDFVTRFQEHLGPRTLSHGDFTPWNTFFVNDKLYVFDWEYAHRSYPHGCDLIHFLFSLPARKRQTVDETTGQIRTTLGELMNINGETSAELLFLGYLTGHALHYIGREREMNNTAHTWDGEQEQAMFIDVLLRHF